MGTGEPPGCCRCANSRVWPCVVLLLRPQSIFTPTLSYRHNHARHAVQLCASRRSLASVVGVVSVLLLHTGIVLCLAAGAAWWVPRNPQPRSSSNRDTPRRFDAFRIFSSSIICRETVQSRNESVVYIQTFARNSIDDGLESDRSVNHNKGKRARRTAKCLFTSRDF